MKLVRTCDHCGYAEKVAKKSVHGINANGGRTKHRLCPRCRKTLRLSAVATPKWSKQR